MKAAYEGFAAVQHDGADLDAFGAYRGHGFGGFDALNRRGVYHYEKRLAGRPRQFNGGRNRNEVEAEGSARNQDRVGVSRGLRGHSLGIAGGVDNHKVGVIPPRLFDQFQQAWRLRRNHSGNLRLAPVAPNGRIGSRVEVKNCRRQPARLGGNGQIHGQGGFPRAAFFAHNGEYLHSSLTCSLVTNGFYNKDTYQNVNEVTCYQTNKLPSIATLLLSR